MVSSFARMAELVDARDLKSLGGNSVPVRFRFRAPVKIKGFAGFPAKPFILSNLEASLVIINIALVDRILFCNPCQISVQH